MEESGQPISCSSWDEQISHKRYGLLLREHFLRTEAQYNQSALKNSEALAKDLAQRVEAQFLTSKLKSHKILEADRIEKQYILSAGQNGDLMKIEQIEPQALGKNSVVLDLERFKAT